QDLVMIGLDRLVGYFLWEEVRAARDAFESTGQISAAELSERLGSGDLVVLDVRSEAEWHEGHLAGARHVPLGELRDRVAELPRDRTVVVHCLGGTRSAIGSSILQAAGITGAINFAGGYNAWLD